MPPVPKPHRTRAPHFIKAWRQFRNKTQMQVAEYLGVDQSTVSNLERGKTPYDQDVLERLSLFLSCDAAELISVDPGRSEENTPRLVYERLREAPKVVQEQVRRVVEAMLLAG